MKRLLLFIIVLTSFTGIVHGQEERDKVIPPSPQTAEFTKYINYNVSAYNGLPEISIPLYNIQLKGISIPIALSYHASGIKFRQTNGEVGVGWSLSPGFRISRSVHGRPDELFGMPSPASVTDSLNYYQGDAYATDRFVSKYVYEFLDIYSPRPHNDERVDGEYDMFNFSLPTESGSFVISDRANKQIKSIEGSNVKFDYDLGNIGHINGITRFRVNDESGSKYYFGADAADAPGIFETSNPQYGGYLATAWALRDIETPFGEKVSFSYTIGTVGDWRLDRRNFIITSAGHCYQDVPGSMHNDDVGSGYYYSTFFTKEIKAERETVKFYRNSGTHLLDTIEVYAYDSTKIRTVRFYYSENELHTFLDSVKILDREDVAIEVYRFDYYSRNMGFSGFIADQWGYYLEGDYRFIYHDEFKDDQVNYYNSAGEPQTLPISVGDYLTNRIRRDLVVNTPDYFSLRQITYPTGGTTEYVYESNQFLGLGNDTMKGGGLRIREIRSNDLVTQKTLVRKYTYGANERGVGIPKVYLNHKMFARQTVGFIHPPDGSESTSSVPTLTLAYSTTPYGDIDQDGFIGSYITYPEVFEYMASAGSDGLADNSGRIQYSYNILNTFNASSLSKGLQNGTPCQVTHSPDYYPLYVHEYAYWHKPQLYAKRYFEFKNDTFDLVKKEEFSYVPSNQFSLSGFKVKSFASSPNYHPSVSSRYYSFINSFYEYGTYTISGGKWLLSRRNEILYNQSDSVLNTVKYAYTDKGHILADTLIGSKDAIFNEYTYPYDLLSISPTSDLNKGVLLLMDRNMIGATLEKRTYRLKANDTARWLLQSTFTQYDKDIPLPGVTYMTRNADLTQSFTPVAVSSSEIVIDPSYKRELSIDIYDSTGNILEIHKEHDTYNSFIWSYKGLYPVAKVVNARHNQTAYTSFEADGKGNWNYGADGQPDATAPGGYKVFSLSGTVTSNTLPTGSYTVSYWNRNGTVLVNGSPGTEIASSNGWTMYRHMLSNVTNVTVSGSGLIDELRLYPTGSQMSTYAYKPLIGMSSEAGPDGQILYYEYDSYNRLKTIRDVDRNILKMFRYKYADQVVPDVVYYNSTISQEFTRNNCGAGYVGGSVTYTVPAGIYAASSQAEADALAQADLTSNGQSYANENGACSAIFYNILMSQAFVKNDCSGGGFGSQVSYAVAAGTYSSMISQADANAQAQADITANGQAYANANGSCTYPTSYYNTEVSQIFTRNNCGTGGTGSSVNYVVPTATYTSTVSQADADAQAQADIAANGQSYANSNGICTYPNTALSQVFTRNNCGSGGTGGNVTFSVAAGQFNSNISQADANAQAQSYMNANGQSYANANGTCTYYNVAWSQAFTKICGPSGSAPPVTYTVPAGTYNSQVSQNDADNLAKADITANGQNYANTHGVCTYLNLERSQAFTKNDCANGQNGTSVTYTVPAGTYSSTVGLLEANALADADIAANGQNYANSNGACQYQNVARSQVFVRNNCGSGYIGDTMVYQVNAGKYTSLISQADADAQADNEIATSGQAYANANLECLSTTITFKVEVESSWPGGGIYQIDFYKPDNSVYSLYPDPYGSSVQNFSMPAGYYYKAIIYVNNADDNYSGSIFFSNYDLACKAFDNDPNSSVSVQFNELNLKGYSGRIIGFSVTTSPCLNPQNQGAGALPVGAGQQTYLQTQQRIEKKAEVKKLIK